MGKRELGQWAFALILLVLGFLFAIPAFWQFVWGVR